MTDDEFDAQLRKDNQALVDDIAAGLNLDEALEDIKRRAGKAKEE